MIIPKNIEIKEDGLLIDWTNGKSHIFPFLYLRLQCPCAHCVEEMTGRPLLDVSTVPGDITILEYSLVGKYALQFLWSNADPCSTSGIYPFEMLLKLAELDKTIKHLS